MYAGTTIDKDFVAWEKTEGGTGCKTSVDASDMEKSQQGSATIRNILKTARPGLVLGGGLTGVMDSKSSSVHGIGACRAFWSLIAKFTTTEKAAKTASPWTS